MKFICPKCNKPLAVSDSGAAVCAARHSYDRAREGYYNLLLTNVGGTHGDNREMLEARRRFLDTGAYSPLAEALVRSVTSAVLASARDNAVVLDVGCGEGYYTALIAEHLAAMACGADLYGFDISRAAIRLSARRVRGAHLAVASAYKMPLADGSVDVAVNVFSPLASEETVRVLRRGGRFIMAIPDENHLFGLKSAIYNTPYKNEVKDTAIAGLTLKATERVAYTLTLDSRERIADLFMMTPYAYRTGRAERERVLSLDSLTTEAEFIILTYEKN